MTLRVCGGLLLAWLAVAPAAAEEVPPGLLLGWDGGDGPTLLREANCVACHAGGDATRFPPRPAPNLSDAGSRLAPEFLRALLANPQAVKAGAAMPDLLAGLAPAQRQETIEQLTHFLASLGGPFDRGPQPVKAETLDQGKLLYHTVGCVACHAPTIAAPKHPGEKPLAIAEDDPPAAAPAKSSRPAVPFPKLEAKTNLSSLAAFLAAPEHVRPSGRMPSLSLNTKESSAIAAWLLREQWKNDHLTPPTAEAFTVDAARAAQGKEKFSSLGCAACHSTGSRPAPAAIDLALAKAQVAPYATKDNRSPGGEAIGNASDGESKTKYLNFGGRGSGLVVTFADQPRVLAGVTLTSANDFPARDPASFLLEGSQDGQSFTRIVEREVPAFAERYEEQSFAFENDAAYTIYRLTFPKLAGGDGDAMQIAEFRLLGSGPRREGVANRLQARPFAQLRPTEAAGCLGPAPAAGLPRFAWSEAQREAARRALAAASGKPPANPEEALALRLNALRCYACHARQGKGGPDDERASFFTYQTLVDFGQEGRLPPPLSDVGAKLTEAGFHEMLVSGQKYRTYMATRMPLFGRAQVGELPALFAAADQGKAPPHEPKFSPKLADDGRTLVGKQHLACVNCHAWGELRLPGAEGLDLLQARQRLQPGWFHALLVNPQQVRPGTRMPTAFPGGKAFFAQIQDGDMHRQIDALWAYVSAGKKAGLPPGLAPKDTSVIVVGDEPVVFRTFIQGLGAHAIAVGFRQRTHLVFDADRIKTSFAWSGDFVPTAAAWEGRGGNYAKITAEREVRFPAGPAFARLESSVAPWPTDPAKPPAGQLRARRNPEGWQFLGYRYAADRSPVFRYQMGEVLVEETPAAVLRDDGASLARSFVLTAKAAVPDLYFRIAAGKQVVEQDGAWVVDGGARYVVQGREKPVLREQEGALELLLRPVFVAAPQGGQRAEFRVEVIW